MPLTVTVDHSALDALLRRLERNDAAKAMAETIAEGADRDVPVDTGRLKASQRIRENADGSYSVTYGDSKVQYAAIVHNSTRGRLNSGQRGWLRKAAMQGRTIGNAVAAEGDREGDQGMTSSRERPSGSASWARSARRVRATA